MTSAAFTLQAELAQPEPPADIIENPLDLLDSLVEAGSIDATERDAGEIIRRMGGHAISDAPGSARVSYNWRYANNIWSTVFETKRETVAKYEAALEAIGSDTARRAVVASLVARKPELVPNNLGALVAGLGALTKHWWGGALSRTTNRNCVTLHAIRSKRQ
jgi:hypothetical protein